jgi:hypothetical protein
VQNIELFCQQSPVLPEFITFKSAAPFDEDLLIAAREATIAFTILGSERLIVPYIKV